MWSYSITSLAEIIWNPRTNGWSRKAGSFMIPSYAFKIYQGQSRHWTILIAIIKQKNYYKQYIKTENVGICFTEFSIFPTVTRSLPFQSSLGNPKTSEVVPVEGSNLSRWYTNFSNMVVHEWAFGPPSFSFATTSFHNKIGNNQRGPIRIKVNFHNVFKFIGMIIGILVGMQHFISFVIRNQTHSWKTN